MTNFRILYKKHMTRQNVCALIVVGESQNLQLFGEVRTLCDLRLSWASKGTMTPL